MRRAIEAAGDAAPGLPGTGTGGARGHLHRFHHSNAGFQSVTLSFIRYDSFAIRSFAHDGAHWCVLPDLCRALGIAAQEVAARLEDDECMAIALRTAAGQQELALAVNVPGLHTVLSRGGRRSKARAFARWMTTQVLPSMAFDGGVVVPPRIGDGLTSTTEIADEVGHAPSTLGRLVGHLRRRSMASSAPPSGTTATALSSSGGGTRRAATPCSRSATGPTC
jgi:prophage antirepressor-like protein